MGFNELFEAIWTIAVDDEIELARRRLRAKGFKVAYRIYQLKGGELPPNDKRFRPFKKDISDYIRLTIEDLSYRISKLIFEESKEWPYNKNTVQQDKEYQELYKELEVQVIEFSKERMLNRWMKI